MAARPPSDPSVSRNSGLATPSTEPVTAESLGRQLGAALPPLRLHSVSLYDEKSNVLWLSEGALGPDEHALVTDAMDALSLDMARACHETRVEDGRAAMFLAVRAPQGALVGLVMILADSKSVSEGLSERLITPQIRTIMHRIAVLLRPANARAAATDPAVRILELREAPPPEAHELELTTPDAASRALSAEGDGSVLTPEGVDEILELELAPEPSAAASSPREPGATTGRATAIGAPAATSAVSGPATGATTNANKALGTVATTNSARALSTATTTNTARALGSATTTTAKLLGATGASHTLALPEGLSLFLDVLPFTRLRAGGRSRRYEVIARATHRDVQRVPPGLDHYALQHLLSWLGANRAAWSTEPTSFTLNLSIATLEDERFPHFVAANLKAHGIAAECVGFEIAEALCLQRRAQVERFIALCDKLGCFVVIDDFSLDSSTVALLRSKSLRLVKIDPKLTTVALKDKLAQALVVAIAQAVKVLGIHCAAKRVDTPSALQWLTAIGCDFAQGSALSMPQALESLGAGTPAL